MTTNFSEHSKYFNGSVKDTDGDELDRIIFHDAQSLVEKMVIRGTALGNPVLVNGGSTGQTIIPRKLKTINSCLPYVTVLSSLRQYQSEHIIGVRTRYSF